eukprot:7905942-Heterocapsa_arctica.AAC.1
MKIEGKDRSYDNVSGCCTACINLPNIYTSRSHWTEDDRQRGVDKYTHRGTNTPYFSLVNDILTEHEETGYKERTTNRRNHQSYKDTKQYLRSHDTREDTK